MKKNIIVLFAVLIIGSTQQVMAQKWLKKGLNVVEKVLTPGTSNSSTSSDSNGRTTDYANGTSLYKIHRTSATKTITLDGDATFMGFFNEGLCVIGWKKGWFVINKEGNKVFTIPQGFEPCATSLGFLGFNSNRLMVYSASNKKAVIYDGSGNIIQSLDNVEKAYGFEGDIALIKRAEKIPGNYSTKTVWYHIDVNGNIITNSMEVSSYDYKLYSITKDGLACAYDENSKKWGYRNKQCQWVIRPTFKDAYAFSDGLAVALDDDGKWGYIDKSGKWAISPIYSKMPGSFRSGLAMVTDKSDLNHFIDKSGRIVWSQSEEKKHEETIRPFMETGYAIWTLDDGVYIIDKSFRKKCKIKLEDQERGFGDEVMTYNDDWFEWRTSWTENGRLIDWNGNILLEFNCGYKNAQEFSNGMCKARNYNYYFNDKGEIVVEFKDTQF